MKTLIICFSQTGNTRKVAESIGDGIVEVTDQCEFVNMDEVNASALGEYDLVGLGCPVFYYREPFNVHDFMQALPELKGKSWFVFCSHGSVLGLTLISMTDQLEKKGITVIGSHHTYADGSLPFYPYPTVTTGHPDAQDLQEARDFGVSIVDRCVAVAAGNRSCVTRPARVTEDWVPDEAFTREFMAQVMPRLSINSETCAKCGECQDSCPANGIDIDSDPPRIQAPCIYCWYCAKICPTCSIEADWSMMVSMAPVNYARYIKALNDAETRGEFRWLIDPNSINFDDPLYKQRARAIREGKE